MGLPDNLEEMHQVAEHYTACRSLRRLGWGGVAFGVINIGLGVLFAIQLQPINLILCVIGLILLIAAIWCLVLPGAEGLIAYGIALILVAGWNILVTIANVATMADAPAGETRAPAWPIALGIAALFGAVDCFKKYARFSEGLRYRVSADEMATMDKVVKRILKANVSDEEDMVVFQTKGFMYQKQWRGRLRRNVALFVEKRTKEVVATDKADMSIEPRGKVLLGKSLKATIQIGEQTWQAVLSPESFDHFRDWKFSNDEEKYFRAQETTPRTRGAGIRRERDRDADAPTSIKRRRSGEDEE
jgi:hypothetical protein